MTYSKNTLKNYFSKQLETVTDSFDLNKGFFGFNKEEDTEYYGNRLPVIIESSKKLITTPLDEEKIFKFYFPNYDLNTNYLNEEGKVLVVISTYEEIINKDNLELIKKIFGNFKIEDTEIIITEK